MTTVITVSYAVKKIESCYHCSLENIPMELKKIAQASSLLDLNFESHSASYKYNKDLKLTLNRIYPGHLTTRQTGLRIIRFLFVHRPQGPTIIYGGNKPNPVNPKSDFQQNLDNTNFVKNYAEKIK